MRIIPRRIVAFSKSELKAVLRLIFRKKENANKVTEFEAAFSTYIGVMHSIAVSSIREGFSRLLDSLDLQEGDEIILSAYNYHVMPIIIKNKGLKPVFVDIKSETLNIDADLIEQQITPRTRCVLATHLFGLAADIEKISEICKRHQLILLEDVAHSCGAQVNGRKIGSFGDFGMFSFGTGKGLVTLGGGMIVSNNEPLFAKVKRGIVQESDEHNRVKSILYFLKSLTQIIFTNRILFALFIYPLLIVMDLFHYDPIEQLTGDKYSSVDVRSKSKLSPFTSFQAVLGLSQLKRMDDLNAQRIEKARLLDGLLGDVDDLKRVIVPNNKEHTFLSYNVITPLIKKLRHYLLLRGIDTKESSMRNCAAILDDTGNYPRVDEVDDKILELPCSQYLSLKDVYYEANMIRKFFTKDEIEIKQA